MFFVQPRVNRIPQTRMNSWILSFYRAGCCSGNTVGL